VLDVSFIWSAHNGGPEEWFVFDQGGRTISGFPSKALALAWIAGQTATAKPNAHPAQPADPDGRC